MTSPSMKIRGPRARINEGVQGLPKPARRRRPLLVVVGLVVATLALGLSLAVGLVFGAATAALAATATSAWGYMTVDSIAYRNQATVSDQSAFTRAYASTYNESRFQQVPTGYLGVRARLYKDSALCTQHSSYQFNSQPAWGYSAPKHGDCGSGVYNSRGLTAHWNSSQGQYAYYYTFWTPSINA